MAHWGLKTRLRKSLWDADHIIPVIEGGGECDLANIRTCACAAIVPPQPPYANAFAARSLRSCWKPSGLSENLELPGPRKQFGFLGRRVYD